MKASAPNRGVSTALGATDDLVVGPPGPAEVADLHGDPPFEAALPHATRSEGAAGPHAVALRRVDEEAPVAAADVEQLRALAEAELLAEAIVLVPLGSGNGNGNVETGRPLRVQAAGAARARG